MDALPRDFKGIWIPKEIWIDTCLSFFEKCLLAEIHSLDGENHCYADNNYFCNFFNVNVRTLQLGLAKLKEMGYISVISFDGRERKLASNLNKTTHEIFDTSRVKKITPQECNNLHPAHIYKRKDKRINTPISPKGDEKVAFGAFVRLSKEEYQEAKNLCGEATDELISEMNDYCAAHGKKYKDYLAAIRTWQKKRAKDPKNAKEAIVETKASWAKEIAKRVGEKARFEVNHEGIVFRGSGPTPDLPIKFSDNGFEEQVTNRLRKMGLESHIMDFMSKPGAKIR